MVQVLAEEVLEGLNLGHLLSCSLGECEERGHEYFVDFAVSSW